MPPEISKIYWLFIHRGSLTAEVTLCKTADTHSAFHMLARGRSISTVIVRGSNNSRYYDFEEQNYNNSRSMRKIFNFPPRINRVNKVTLITVLQKYMTQE